MSMLASLRRSSSRGHDTVGVESLMGSFILAGLMEGPVLVEVAAGAQGAQPQYSLGTGQTPAGTGYLQDAECGTLVYKLTEYLSYYIWFACHANQE